LLPSYCTTVSSYFERPKRRGCIPSNPTHFPHQFFKRGFLLGPFRLQVNFSSLLPGNIWNYSLLKTPSPSIYGTQGFPNNSLFNHSAGCPQPLTKRDLLLPLSIYSIPSFPQGLVVAAYVFFIVFPSLLSFPLSFRQLGVLEGSSKWFHSFLIRTTHPFLNEIWISANSCSYLPVCTSVRVPQKWIFERVQ
jgi:hypothetical protein